MRLIDADELDKEIAGFFMAITGDPKPTTVVRECKKSFRRIINEQPTQDLNKLVEEHERLKGLEIFHKDVSEMPDCNDCRKMNCEFRPEPGQKVRFNCPLWEGRKNV